MKRTSLLAIAFAMTGTIAMAQTAAETAVSDLQAQGYTNIEVKSGVKSVKVEGVKNGQKVELTIDKTTGEVLKRETESQPGAGGTDDSSSSSDDDGTPDQGSGDGGGSDDGAGHDGGDDHGGGDHGGSGEGGGHDGSGGGEGGGEGGGNSGEGGGN